MADEKNISFVGEDLDFDKTLFLHINRILQVLSQSRGEEFVSSVEGLYICLSPYFDDKFKDKDKIVSEWMEKELKKVDRRPIFGYFVDMAAARMSIVIEVTRQKFQLLMGLAERKNLLLKRKREETYELPEENTNDNNSSVDKIQTP